MKSIGTSPEERRAHYYERRLVARNAGERDFALAPQGSLQLI